MLIQIPHPIYHRYLIGEDGSVFGPSGKRLSALPNKGGYPCVTLRHNEKLKRIPVHVLVCEAFWGLRPTAKHGVAHWDGTRNNNWATNLRWATQKENTADMKRHGRGIAGEKHHQTSLTDEQAREIMNSPCRNGAELARRYGVSRTTISRIRLRRSWRHL